MKRLHLIVGLAGLAPFLATGAYMRVYHGGMDTEQQQIRLLMRSRHIYILLASLVNLALSTRAAESQTIWRRRLGRIGSGLVAAAPLMLLIAFVRDAATPDSPGDLVLPAIISIVVGTLCCALGWTGRTY